MARARGGRLTAAGYAERVLGIVERRALYADRVDWPPTRASIVAAARDAAGPAELYDVLRELVAMAGGPHSAFVPPGRGGRSAERQVPAARVVDGVGVLVLPGVRGRPDEARPYAAAGGRALRALPPVRGWVVDLRGNRGGAMWPMLAVAAPLLGPDPAANGEVGAFVFRNGLRQPWRIRRRWVLSGGRRWPRARSRGPYGLAGPVAVLTDGRTVSAGEAAAVAFRGRPGACSYGAPTQGLTTGNETFALPDGARLVLTVCRLADRTGVVYDGPLPPDVPADDPLAAALADLRR